MRRNIIAFIVTMLICIAFGMPMSVAAADSPFAERVSVDSIEATPIEAGGSFKYSEEASNQIVWYSFTPDKTAAYEYGTDSSSSYVKAAIYKCEGNELVKVDSDIVDVYGEDSFFEYIYEMTAGETYYLAATRGWYSAYFKEHEHTYDPNTLEDEKYYYINSTEHEKRRYAVCWMCNQRYYDSWREKHSGDSYSLCWYCKFPSAAATLTSGQYHYFSGRPYLKISVSKPGMIIVQSIGESVVYNCNKVRVSDNLKWSYANNCVPVKKGTYYLRPYENVNGKIKYTFKSVPIQTNTSRKKAYTAAKGAEKNVVMYGNTKSRQYRWYKIKLKSKRKVSIYQTYEMPIADIFNSKGKLVGDATNYGGKSGKFEIYKTKTLKAGTYYIRYTNLPYKGKTSPTAGQFKWK